MRDEFKPTQKEMIEAITRSGYLLEANIAKYLTSIGFFVETNQVIEDVFTQKSREIDIVAEYYNPSDTKLGSGICAKVEFIFEVKNNLFPLILINEYEFTPLTEYHLGLKEIETLAENSKYSSNESFFEYLIESQNTKIFTQYCSFQKKKQNDELMALHPENIHEGLSKIIQYCDEQIEHWDDVDTEFHSCFRKFLYLPILLINDDLYELHNDNLIKVESSFLVVNYHRRSEKNMAYVAVVTKNGLDGFIKKILEIERKVESNMHT